MLLKSTSFYQVNFKTQMCLIKTQWPLHLTTFIIDLVSFTCQRNIAILSDYLMATRQRLRTLDNKHHHTNSISIFHMLYGNSLHTIHIITSVNKLTVISYLSGSKAPDTDCPHQHWLQGCPSLHQTYNSKRSSSGTSYQSGVFRQCLWHWGALVHFSWVGNILQ